MVNLLLERGAKMNSEALEDALKEGYEYVICLINVNQETFLLLFALVVLASDVLELRFVAACLYESIYIYFLVHTPGGVIFLFPNSFMWWLLLIHCKHPGL